MLVLVVAVACGGGGGGGGKRRPTGVDPRIVVAVDPRVELLSIVSRLAGYPEYSHPANTPYVRAVDEHFARWREHPAVVTARGLRRDHGVGYNAPIGLAAYLDAHFTPRRPLTPPLPDLDARWNAVDMTAYVTQLQDFARASDLAGFLAAHRDHHARVAAALRTALDGHRIVDWYDAHFGPRPTATFRVVPGLLTGGNSYSAQATDDDPAQDIVLVIYLHDPDADGVPRPTRDLVYTVVHEFAHAYVNPALGAHADLVLPAATPLHARHAAIMARQNYPAPEIMANESVVRALCVLYAADRGVEGAAVAQMVYERQRGFLWIKPLADALTALRARHGGKLPAAELAAATRDVFTAWSAENP